jgi:hypothetical protein
MDDFDVITILPHSMTLNASNQAQPCDLCAFGLPQRGITRVNKLAEGNMDFRHLAKLVSAFRSAHNSMNVIASF